MLNCCITADRIGMESGGGLVTKHELQALTDLGTPVAYPDYDLLNQSGDNVWAADTRARMWVEDTLKLNKIGLAHFYSGTMGATVRYLKNNGIPVSYTIAAHDKEVSRREHERYAGGFPYPHLVQGDLWARYIEGYRQADCIICPSQIAAKIVRNYGPEFQDKRIEVIPHGCDIPAEEVHPLPQKFVLGYMGAIGLDKGLIYLLQAWKRLAYKDALLLMAGRDTTSQSMINMAHHFGGGNIQLIGWMNHPSDFYNQITVLVQPSATEGFGIEVPEAMAHGRSVICSEGAGAADIVPEEWRVPACDVDALASKINSFKLRWEVMKGHTDIIKKQMESKRDIAREYTWDKIRKRYQDVWRSM